MPLKYVITVLMIFTPLLSKGQITIDNKINPEIGDTIKYYITNWQQVDSSKGMQTWDFSTLNKTDSSISKIFPVSEAPHPDSFPEATYYLSGKSGGIYGSADLSGQYIHGSFQEQITGSGKITTRIDYPHKWNTFSYPFSYKESDTSKTNALITMTINGNTFQGTRNQETVYTYDGYGTLILPYSTINQTALIKTEQHITDSFRINGIETLYLYDRTIFTWFIPDIFDGILTFTKLNLTVKQEGSQTLDTTYTSGSWASQTSLPKFSDIHQTQNQTCTKVFPNPAKDRLNYQLQINQTDHVKIVLRNLTGEPVKTLYQGALQPGNHSFTFDISYIKAGIYLLEGAHNSHKLIIQ